VTPAQRQTARRLGLALLLLYLLTAWAGPPLDAMAGRTLALAEALSHGRLRVNQDEAQLSGDFLWPDGPDGGGVAIAEFGGSALFAPVCVVVRSALDGSPRKRVVFVESTLYVVLLCALPAAVAAVLLYALLLRLGVPAALPAALVFGATPLWAQACVVSPHPLSIAFSVAALLALSDRARTPRASAVAGLCAGCAVLTWFGALLPVALPLGLYGIATGSRRARLAFVAGAAGPALLLGLWNLLNNGAPWAFPDLGRDGGWLSEVAARNAVFSLSLPTPRRVWEVTVGTRRGLLIFAPALLLAPAGFKLLWRRHRSLTLLLIAIAVATALQAACKPLSWHGGTAAGPRYLIPGALALCVPLGYGLAAFPRLGTALGGLSFCFALCTSLSALYGSLRACVEEVLAMGPRLRWVYACGIQLDSTPSHGWAVAISAAVALPLLGGVAWALRRELPGIGRAAAVLALAWGALAVRGGLVGHLGHGPPQIRHDEVLRFVVSEPEPLRLRWYAQELLGLGDPLNAAHVSLRAIELGGWDHDPQALDALRTALHRLQSEGHEVRPLLQRAAELKRQGG